MKILLLLAACAAGSVLSFAPSCSTTRLTSRAVLPQLQSTPEPNEEPIAATSATDDATSEEEELTPEEIEKVGNLVADEEWAGLSMELADVVRTAVVEDLKKNSRDFLGKDDYALGDFSKEIDSRVKEEVAKMREKDEYEVSGCRKNWDTVHVIF